jgi:two-component system, NarL family, nitrate/nitrite response regulator NarL
LPAESVEGEPLIQVFVISSIRLYRDGLVALLAQYPGIRVVGAEAPDHPSVASAKSDVFLVDVASHGAAIVGKLVRESVAVVIAFGLGQRDEEVIATVEAGAAGFVLGEDGIGEIVESIECAARGEVRCSAQVAAVLARRLASLAVGRDGEAGAESKLTARELQIIRLVDDGLSNKEIARALHIQVATVKNHVHSILEKLNVSRRAEAAARVRTAFRDRRADQVPVLSDPDAQGEIMDPHLAAMGARTSP